MKKKANIFPMAKIITIFFLTFFVFKLFGQQTIKVTVRAYNGVEEAKKKWSATTDYLSNSIDSFIFELVPIVGFKEMREVVKNNQVDFVLTNPTNYIDLSVKYGIGEIVTLINGRGNSGNSEFGSVAFSLANRDDIKTLKDIKRKSIMGVNKEAFGGWQMIYRELLEIGIDPFNDCSKVLFSPTATQENIVFEVLQGNVDIGVVRTGILETLEMRGEIDLKNIKIIDPVIDDFPLIRTSRLYPEWPFAALKNTDKVLSKKVAIALLQMEKENPACETGGYSGWRVSLSYDKVLEILKIIKAPPFDSYPKVSVIEFLKSYWQWFLFTALAVLILVLTLVYILRLNTKLNEARNKLEMKVESRTLKLKQVNINLQKEIDKRKSKEKELKLANKIINRSPVVAFLWKNKKGWPVEFVSKNIKKLSGYSVDEFMRGEITYSNIIHKDDIINVGAEVARYSKEEKTKSFAHKPYRIITKTGEIKWLNDITFIRRGADGEITHFEGIVYDTTVQIITAEKTKMFSRIFENSLNEIYLFDDETLNFTEVNPAARKNLGYSIDELQNLTPVDIKPGFTSESFEKLLTPLRKNKTVKYVFETTHQRKDKSLYNVEVHMQLLKNGPKSQFVAIILDVTERKKAEIKLQNSKDYIQTIFDSTSDAIFIHDVETGIILDVNQQVVTMFGHNKKDILNGSVQPISMGESPYSEKEAFEWLQKSRTEGKQTFQWHSQHKKGHLFWVEVSIVFVQIEGENRYIASVRNIDDRKKAETELEKYRKQLEETVKKRTDELAKKNSLLERLNKVFVGRELRMIELKDEIEKLKNG
ncbi:MAG: PAS domain S-box protein [Prolixibacteraceae bacterium]|jgi:PAS domain S-box-containing protein|nr:PAS domain S-box protein [Prolixibacteraceae bacterium]MBT6764463.1 PAS domain S-box protein [Prolixibacteraceae bacterium]MBT6997358.1 PAS domain S-box protein [Prolixibacteraceae bacterium]MBT7396706.1 PAS domain S-box protein [Prolixibacteraceae bacterium]